MANNGQNKGRRLRVAISRFAAMLIEEAMDISGAKGFEQLDEALDFPTGRCAAYAKYPLRRKTRAPQADEIQNLENLVARLLKRPTHIIVIEENRSVRTFGGSVNVVGEPDAGINLRDFDENDLQLGYQDDWPTYRRLKYNSLAHLTGESLIGHYCWQWGILYDRGLLVEPWKTMMLGVTGGVAIESLIPERMKKMKAERAALLQTEAILAGILPELPGQQE